MRFCQLLSVVFGLKSAPAWASIVSAELARVLQSFGISVAGVYLDDFLIRARSKKELVAALKLAERIASDLGVPFNDKGSGPRSPDEGVVYLGVLIKTANCSMRVTSEHRAYALSRVNSVIANRKVSVDDLQSLCGILTWISYVLPAGKPRRHAMYQSLTRMLQRSSGSVRPRGEFLRTLQWWRHTLASKRSLSAPFWSRQPDTPLVCSDASGDDGWGACVMGFHFVGPWPDQWRQSDGHDSPSMLFKELVPPVVTSVLLAPLLRKQVLCCALDNAGAAFTLNSLCCGCARSLQPLSDSLSCGNYGLLAGHAHRERNSHTDTLSHSLSTSVWSQVVSQAPIKKPHRMEFHFAALDVKTEECCLATWSCKRAVHRPSSTRDARDASL